MVILKTRDGLRLSNEVREEVAAALAKEAETGVLLLPIWCELVAVTESSAEVQIITGDRPQAELEAELALTLEYINKTKCCYTCKHNKMPGKPCAAGEGKYDCSTCGDMPTCICWQCDTGSKWEWRGAHGDS